jgi:hypothetical protein
MVGERRFLEWVSSSCSISGTRIGTLSKHKHNYYKYLTVIYILRQQAGLGYASERALGSLKGNTSYCLKTAMMYSHTQYFVIDILLLG